MPFVLCDDNDVIFAFLFFFLQFLVSLPVFSIKNESNITNRFSSFYPPPPASFPLPSPFPHFPPFSFPFPFLFSTLLSFKIHRPYPHHHLRYTSSFPSPHPLPPFFFFHLDFPHLSSPNHLPVHINPAPYPPLHSVSPSIHLLNPYLSYLSYLFILFSTLIHVWHIYNIYWYQTQALTYLFFHFSFHFHFGFHVLTLLSLCSKFLNPPPHHPNHSITYPFIHLFHYSPPFHYSLSSTAPPLPYHSLYPPRSQ